MSIKRRLYISNALMIILPLLLVIVANAVAYFVFIDAADTHSGADRHALWGYFVFLILIVFTINVLLTRFVFRGIMNPIKALTTGVHEIRDGNLAYRIEYEGDDEFASVCDDFNEMGARLSEMVEQRQKDERNRRELIAGISHDLRTPLTSIKAYLEGLEKGVATTPEMEKKYLEIINSKTENLEYIINQLFMFSKLDIGELPIKKECVNIVEELKKIASDAEHEYKNEGLFIEYAGEQNPIDCMIDTVQFGNVMQNIITNSLKYKDKETVSLILSCSVDAANAVVTILDDGPGVSGAALDKLFNIFYREDESRQKSDDGSGIGLAISQKIIEQLGGTIVAKKGESRGLEVIIKLPICEKRHNG